MIKNGVENSFYHRYVLLITLHELNVYVYERSNQKNSTTYDIKRAMWTMPMTAPFIIYLVFSLLVPLRWIYSRKWYGAHKRFLRYTNTHTHAHKTYCAWIKATYKYTYSDLFFFYFVGFFFVFHSELCFCAIWITHFIHMWIKKK